MSDERFHDGRMLVEADNMTHSDAVFIPKALQGKTTTNLCEFPGCTELTIFGLCSPHAREGDRRLIEELRKQGWKVFGAGDDTSARPDPGLR